MSNEEITATFRAATAVIVQQGLDGELSPAEVAERVERARRLAECARLGVPVVSVQMRDVSRIARLLGVRI